MGEMYSVKAVLSADISNFVSGMGMAAQSMRALGEDASLIQNIGRAAGVAGKGLTMGLTLPLVGIGAASLKAGADFDAGMSKVQAISGASAADMARLRDMAKQMGATTKFSASQSAEALSYMGMAGWKTDQMIAGLPGIMNLAAASGEDLGMVSDIVTDSLTAFGMSANDTGRFVDVLAAAATNSNTNVAMMGDTFKYAAPIAGALGYSVEDTALAVGLMANAGIKGSQAGTALRSALTRLEAPTAEVRKGMQMLGLNIKDLQGMTLDQKLQTLRGAFAGLDESQKVQAASLLFGKNAMSGMLAIINASESEYNGLKDAINNSTGAAKNMAEIMENNLKGSVTKLKSALEGAGIAIGEILAPKIKMAVDKITELVSAFTRLDPSTQKLIVNIGLVVAAIGPMFMIISKVISTFLKIKSAVSIAGAAFRSFKAIMAATATPVGVAGRAMAGLAKVIGVLAGPVGIAIAAVVAFIAIMVHLYKTNERVRAVIDGAWTAIKDTVRSASEAIAAFVQAIWGRISEFISTNSSQIQDIVSNAWQVIGDIVATVMETIAPLVALGWETIKTGAQVAWELITGVIQVALEVILGVLQAGMQLLQGDWRGAWETIKEMASNVWQIISDKAIAIFDALKAYFMTLWDGIKESIVTAWEGIKESLIATWDGIVQDAQEKWNGLKEFFATLWDGVKSAAIDAWNAIKDGIMSVIGPLVDKVKESFTKLKERLKNIWENIKTIGQTVWSAIKTIIFGLVAALLQAITGDWEGAKDTLRQIWEKLKGDAQTIWNNIKDAIQTAIKAAVDIAKSLMDGLKSTLQGIRENIKRTISSAMDNIKSKIQSGFEQSKAKATQSINNMKSAVSQGFTNIVSTVKSKMSHLVQSVVQGFTNAISRARNIAGQGVSVGVQMVAGFVRGIMSRAAALAQSAAKVVRRAISAAKSAAGIHSPSRVMKEVGKNFVLGGIIGIDKEAAGMARASSNAMKETIKAFGKPEMDIGATMDKISGSVGTQVDYRVRDNLSGKQPAQIVFRLGDREFKGFVDDITKVQGNEVRLQEVYGV